MSRKPSRVIVAPIGVEIGQGGDAAPGGRIRSELVQAAIAHLDQPDVFQVLMQAPVGALQLLDGQVGQVLLIALVRVGVLTVGAFLVAIARQQAVALLHREERGASVTQVERPARFDQGTVERPAEGDAPLQRVDVRRLQRGVLAVVGERDQLAFGRRQLGQDVADQHVGGGGAAHRAVGEQFVELGGLAGVVDTARRTHQQRLVNNRDVVAPCVVTLPVQPVAGGTIGSVFGDRLAVALAHPAGRGQPVLGQGHIRRVEAAGVQVGRRPLMLAVHFVSHQAAITLNGHAVELLPARAAEVEREGGRIGSALGRTGCAGAIPAVVEVGVAVAIQVQARTDAAPLREERMQLGHEPAAQRPVSVRDLCDHPGQQRGLDLATTGEQIGSRSVVLAVGLGQRAEIPAAARQPVLDSHGGRLPAQQRAEPRGRGLVVVQRPAEQRLDQRPRGRHTPVEGRQHLRRDLHFGRQRGQAILLTERRQVFLDDHALGRERFAEQPRRKPRDDAALVARGPFALHRGAGADAAQPADRVRVLLQAADQARNVGPAFAGVGVDLIQHQETQHARLAEQLAILEAGEDQLQLDVVGHQDVGHGTRDRPAPGCRRAR